MFGTILVPSSDGDMNEYLAGLERLRDLDPPLLFPGHGPMVANPKRLLTRYLNHRKERHLRVLNAMKSSYGSLDSITREAYADTPDAHPNLAMDFEFWNFMMYHQLSVPISNQNSIKY